MSDQAGRLRELVATGVLPLRALAVASGKGGVGKTNLVVNLALALGLRGRRVVVLDGDLGLANVDVMLGLCPRYSLYDVLKGECRLEDAVLEGPANLRLIPAGSGIAELADLDGGQRVQLVNSLRRFLAGAEFLLIDTGAGIGRGVMSLLSTADEVIVVVTPEPTSLADGYALIKVLGQGRLHSRVNLVVNRAESAAEAQQVLRRLALVVNRFLDIELRYLGFVYNDPAVPKAVARQQPVVLSHPHSRAARQFNYLAGRLLEEEVPPQDGGFMRRLLRLFG
ncbi:MAG: MinD/ParA family protein [Clostridia bacterium]|jgi:flagellar biosynthesis protein FlhG|nr:MinD/ParA family protein [Clostridia bacterium]MDH7573472.1 MinD/ParA family protein [Clostridia bacterium]